MRNYLDCLSDFQGPFFPMLQPPSHRPDNHFVYYQLDLTDKTDVADKRWDVMLVGHGGLDVVPVYEKYKSKMPNL